MKVGIALAALALVTFPTACGTDATIKVGVMYPTTGAQAVQGAEEKQGVELAAQWVNSHGGVGGRRLVLVAADLDRAEGVPAAMDALQRAGVSVVVGTHGSTFSAVAAAEATRRHMLVWETGAVGNVGVDVLGPLDYERDGPVAGGVDFIRMAPMGGDLGKAAVDFVGSGLAPLMPRRGPLRWAIAYVNDPYGRAVSAGAAAEVRATGQPVAGLFAYDAATTDFSALAARIAASKPDALYVAAYLDDGTALRTALAAQHVPLVVNLGTSSSYCMPEFGARLGATAVGVFASDKPDAAAVNPAALSPEGRSLLTWFSAHSDGTTSSHELSGFSNAYALFAHVLAHAGSASAAAVSAAALSIKLPIGTLPNGGGLDIAPPGSADAGNNRNAAGVIWEWVAPGVEDVVWPPPFATHPVVWTPIDE